MKRLCVLLLAVVLMIGICACAKPEDIVKVDDSTVNVSDNRSNYDKAVSFVERSIDVSKMSVSTQDESDGQDLYCAWTVDGEQPAAEIGKEVTLDGQKLVLGTTLLKEVKDMGFTCEIPAETIETDTVYGFTLNKGTKWINADLDNHTGSDQKADDLAITGLNLIAGDNELTAEAMPFDYYGIKSGTSFEDILKILGDPNNGVTLSTGSTGCSIELNYFADNTSLSVFLRYDPAADVATLGSINLSISE